MRPLSGWAAGKAEHTSKGAAGRSTRARAGCGGCGGRRPCSLTGHLYANLGRPSKLASAWPAGRLYTQRLSVRIGPLCPRPGFVGAEAAQHLHLGRGRWRDLAAIWKFA